MTTATIHTKQTDGLRIKSTDDEIGLIEAVVNRMNVIDADGDRILSGAFTETLKNLDKEPVAMLWGHDSQQVIGKLLDAYEVGLENGEAVLVAKLLCNLDTERGRSAYSDIKMGAVAAWSIGFNCDAGDIKSVTDPDGQKVFEISALSLVEISAVLRGSSPGTSTLSVKESTTEKGAIPSHDTPTSDQNWDGSAVVASLPDTGDDAALYRDVFAWVNSAPDASPEAKSSYKFPHHDYPDTTANIKACQSIVGVLNGAMGGSSIPEDDRQAVWNHAARHLRDAGITPADLKEDKATIPGKPDKYTTAEEARDRADELPAACEGAHQMTAEDGSVYFMPCQNHAIYESLFDEGATSYEDPTPTQTANLGGATGQAAATLSRDDALSASKIPTDAETTPDHAVQRAADAIRALAASEVARVKLAWLKTQEKRKQ